MPNKSGDLDSPSTFFAAENHWQLEGLSYLDGHMAMPSIMDTSQEASSTLTGLWYHLLVGRGCTSRLGNVALCVVRLCIYL